MSRLETILRVMIVLIAITLLGNGFLWGFTLNNLETYSITTEGALGLNMIKSNISSGQFSAFIFLVMYTWRRGFWFYPAIILVVSYLIPRIVSLFVDGSHPTILIGIALEAFVAIVLVALWRMESAE
ncbi:MAG: hypothetical protein AAF702_29560 [Chloroflexota bacterium]